MNTRLLKRFGRKLGRAVFEFTIGVLVVAVLLGIFAAMVMAGAWVAESLFGAVEVSKWLGGLVLAICAVWLVGEVGTLYAKTREEVAEEDDKIMSILKGDNT